MHRDIDGILVCPNAGGMGNPFGAEEDIEETGRKINGHPGGKAMKKLVVEYNDSMIDGLMASLAIQSLGWDWIVSVTEQK